MQCESCTVHERSHLIGKPECHMSWILDDNLIGDLGPGLCKHKAYLYDLSKSAAALHDAGDTLILFSRYTLAFFHVARIHPKASLCLILLVV